MFFDCPAGSGASVGLGSAKYKPAILAQQYNSGRRCSLLTTSKPAPRCRRFRHETLCAASSGVAQSVTHPIVGSSLPECRWRADTNDCRTPDLLTLLGQGYAERKSWTCHKPRLEHKNASKKCRGLYVKAELASDMHRKQEPNPDKTLFWTPYRKGVFEAKST